MQLEVEVFQGEALVIMGLLNLFQSKQVDALGVRPNLKRLNMLSERAEAISMWLPMPCFNWKRNIHRLEKFPSSEGSKTTFILKRESE